MLLSVIISIYNSYPYMPQCIESVIGQTYEDFEILLINDGSTDIKTHDLCDYYLTVDPRIRLINKENGGVASARNCGIDNSYGQYLCFIDGDDYVHKDWLHSFYTIIERNPNTDFIIGRMSFSIDGTKSHFVKNDTVEGLTGEQALINITKDRRFFSMGVRGAYKREMIIANDIYFPVDSYYEDIDWTFNAITHAKNVMSNENPFYYWRMRKDSVSRNVKLSDELDIINVLKMIYEYKPKYTNKYIFRNAISRIINVRYIAKYIKYAKELDDKDLDAFNEMIKDSKYLISKCFDRNSLILRLLFFCFGVRLTTYLFRKFY